MVLEWTSRSAYALTELVLFLIICFIVFATIIIVFVVVLWHYWGRKSFSLLNLLFENVFTSAIAFSQRRNGGKENIVFLGNEQLDDKHFKGTLKSWGARVWVYIYFTLLCSVAVLWFATVFSDAVLYRKTGTCLDLNVRDSDVRCFLLSTADVPPEVQEIINEEEGEAVPCQRVQNYIILNNSTFDLEVVCYLARLSPLPALGVAYGSMKTIVFAIVSLLTVFLSISDKIRAHSKSLYFIGITHGIQIGISLLIIVIMVAIISSLHESTSTRNTTFDFLRGERFYHSSVVALAAVTIFITFGLFPWWAFKPLKPTDPIDYSGDDPPLAGHDYRDDIHNMILLHQFSIRYR